MNLHFTVKSFGLITLPKQLINRLVTYGIKLIAKNGLGVALCVTLVGIPFGKQCFKLAHISCKPFGRIVV